jgi:hypothetical protein
LSKIVDVSLRKSAQAALLGRIHGSMRLIKINESNGAILLSVIMSAEPYQNVIDDISEAATEILADFPENRISEKLEVPTGEIPQENMLEAGWIFRRAER